MPVITGNLSALSAGTGIPDKDNTLRLKTSASATTSGISLSRDTTYRFAADEDMYIYVDDNTGAANKARGWPLYGGVPEEFTTTASGLEVVASGVSAAGQLTISAMIP